MMKLSKLVGERFKERPSECVINSHSLMTRGGYMKHVASGIFSSYTILRRINRKIEQIIREEMDLIDGQEVLFPVALPASLWEQSGRYDSVGNELLRFTDRNNNPMILGMTHEEAAVHLTKEYGQTYTKYPFMIYQIQTKFRDETRPRGGLIRVREFTMKDAYSFHTSEHDLEEYYEKCYHAYERIFTRVGLPEVISVTSDSGMMGGKISHEFMLLTPVGEDSIATCKHCGFKANAEMAESIIVNDSSALQEELQKINTPDCKTIEDVCTFLNLPVEKSCKAIVYQKKSNNEYVVLFIRGDLEANETKLRNFLNEEIYPAVITEESGLAAGYLGPYNLNGHTILFDTSLKNIGTLCCGANEPEYHYTGLNIERDLSSVEYHDFAKIKDSSICPKCKQKAIDISRGIEVGNIFQLGSKYTESMDMKYSDNNGELKYPLMCSYGIGVERLAASICEANNDEYGPIWPMAIAPWQVHLCCMRADDMEAKAFADNLYEELLFENIEVIYDDRTVSAGVMFSDADLIGVPIRIIVSPRNLKENCCEVVTRDKSVKLKVGIEDIVSDVKKLVKSALDFPYNPNGMSQND